MCGTVSCSLEAAQGRGHHTTQSTKHTTHSTKHKVHRAGASPARMEFQLYADARGTSLDVEKVQSRKIWRKMTVQVDKSSDVEKSQGGVGAELESS